MSKATALLIITGLAAGITGCHKTPETPVAAQTPTASAASAAPSGGAASVDAGGFTVAVTLSPAAATKLAAIHEQVEVAAYYYGMPTPAGKARADEVGQVDLGIEKVDIAPVNGNAAMTTKPIDGSLLPFIENRMPMVLINVYTARKAHPDNLLNCGIFEDTLTVARQKPIAIHCALITES